jgi:hypothetical protein
MLSLLFPVVHNQRLHFVDVGGKVIFLAPLRQVTQLIPVGCSIIAGNQA